MWRIRHARWKNFLLLCTGVESGSDMWPELEATRAVCGWWCVLVGTHSHSVSTCCEKNALANTPQLAGCVPSLIHAPIARLKAVRNMPSTVHGKLQSPDHLLCLRNTAETASNCTSCRSCCFSKPRITNLWFLRPHGHTHSLPSVKTTNFMKSFIIKSLFSYKKFYSFSRPVAFLYCTFLRQRLLLIF